eukprot:5759916-Lingulodinium_polyedra.AAC.1
MEPLRDTLALLADASFLEQCGLSMQFKGASAAFPDMDGCFLAQQNSLSHQIGMYLTSLVKQRAKRTLYLSKGWTGQQALLIHPDPEVRQHTCKELLEQEELWYMAAEQTLDC